MMKLLDYLKLLPKRDRIWLGKEKGPRLDFWQDYGSGEGKKWRITNISIDYVFYEYRLTCVEGDKKVTAQPYSPDRWPDFYVEKHSGIRLIFEYGWKR
jgi:hypothetical protein